MSATEHSSRRKLEPRQKRIDGNRPTKPVSVRRTTKSKKVGDPPVMARASAYGVFPRLAKPRRKVKRRFDILVNPGGAEMRLPALPQIGLDWRLLSLVLTAVLGFGLYQILTLPLFRVEAAQVNGLEHVSRAQIEQTLDLSGEMIFALNPLEIEKTLLSTHPEFSRVEVSVGIPNQVEISVIERSPVLVWRMGGISNLVDADGMPFSLRENFPVIDLPVVHAEEFGAPPAESSEEPDVVQALISPKMVEAVLQLSEVAPLGANLVYTAEHGLGWQEPDGRFIYFGNDEEIYMKYSVYEALWKQLQGEGLEPVFVSVEHVHVPYYHLADE
jgi:hypothetical protein